MPIRINLLAEAQAAEELRRKDPVKRALLVAVGLVVVVLVWIGSLQVKILADNSHLNSLESRLNSRTNQYTKIIQNKDSLQTVDGKLTALNHLAAQRFLEANLLDGPMHAIVDGIQLVRLRTEHSFETTSGTPAVVKNGKTIVPAKPAGSIEHVKLILDAKDISVNPGGEQITKFKETLAHTAYFQAQGISTNNILLKNLSAPQMDNDSSKTFIMFSLECQYPERSRSL